MDNGDTLILHDDRPPRWRPAAPAALLVHGLAGCHNSGYMARVAGKLNDAGVRTFRMDMRACGAGEGLARMPYHAGIWEDLELAVHRVVQLCPASPVSLVGFSIGGNVALKLLAEAADRLPPQLDRAVVVNPAVDLTACVEHFSSVASRLYERHFVRLLFNQLNRSDRLVEHAPQVAGVSRPRRMREFDTLYTSVVWGFDTVEEFYAEISSRPVLDRVCVPSLVIASRDDPLVPVEMFDGVDENPLLTLHLTDAGGHLGFIGKAGVDADRRWMDWRILDWIQADLHAATAAAA